MNATENYLPLQDMVEGTWYVVEARNFNLAIWHNNKFIGIRNKFGFTFESVEYHWDDGAPHGTVKPLREFLLLD